MIPIPGSTRPATARAVGGVGREIELTAQEVQRLSATAPEVLVGVPGRPRPRPGVRPTGPGAIARRVPDM